MESWRPRRKQSRPCGEARLVVHQMGELWVPLKPLVSSSSPTSVHSLPTTSVAIWCNQDPCGIICAVVTWSLIAYASYVNTVSGEPLPFLRPSPLSPTPDSLPPSPQRTENTDRGLVGVVPSRRLELLGLRHYSGSGRLFPRSRYDGPPLNFALASPFPFPQPGNRAPGLGLIGLQVSSEPDGDEPSYVPYAA